MRPGEIAVLATVLIGFCVLAFPTGRSPRWLPLVALAGPASVTVQHFAEGTRWQLLPAYFLAALAALLTVIRVRRWPRSHPRDRARRGWSRRILRTAEVLGVTLGLAIATALPALFPIFRFPAPTGPYAIGTVTYHWTENRAEAFTSNPHQRRELLVQMWYPAQPEPDAARTAYVPDPATLAPLARLLGLPGFALDYLDEITTNAVQAAPVSPAIPSYPLLILTTGRAGYRQYDTAVVEDLVSRGYLVAALDQPYADAGVRLSDGRLASLDPRMLDNHFADTMVGYLADDVTFALDMITQLDRHDPAHRLTGRVDLHHVGAMGVSLGGQIAAEACLRDPRLTACLPVDTWMSEDVAASGLAQPTMWLTRDAATMRQEGWSSADIDRVLGTTFTTFDRLRGPGYVVQIPGMYHADFADTPLLSPLTRPLGITGPIDPALAHRTMTDYIRVFLDRYLSCRTSSPPNWPTGYPGIMVHSRSTTPTAVCASVEKVHPFHPVATRCGRVLTTDVGINTDICVRAGDSGGPLFSQIDLTVRWRVHGLFGR